MDTSSNSFGAGPCVPADGGSAGALPGELGRMRSAAASAATDTAGGG